MPTPVCTARQCLTEEAARALDDAVVVARRRSHAQTTSLHAVSALLALPSSTLRDACARARSAAYSPRLQFRALELSVGVSLDRLPTSKDLEEPPPVSNSLMAAIKRSQANQRRHPDTFHLYQQIQQQQSQSSLSCVKVELKHFILSILDDPSVSRVFGEAGFGSYDIKLAILHPPSISRFPRSRCAPMFLCNLDDSVPNCRGFNFPFAGISGIENGDENCRNIGAVLAKEKSKNPLLIGACAVDALTSFRECIQRGKTGLLPAQIDGLSLICVEKEISEFITKLGSSQEMVDLKFKEVSDLVENCSGPGIVVSVGDVKVFLAGGSSSVDSVPYVVSKLSGLLEAHGGRLWLIGAARSYEIYMKISALFPHLQKDWDLHMLPITSSKPSGGGLFSKPSLMGSFVPLGGFFPSPSEFKKSTNQSTRCDLCNEKYEQEVSVTLKGGSNTSVSNQYSESVSSWLLEAEYDTSKRLDMVKVNDDGTALNAKLMGIERKWNDICHRLHSTRSLNPDILQTRCQIQHAEGSQFVADGKENSSKDSSSNDSRSSSLISSMPMDLLKVSPLKQIIASPLASEAENTNFHSRLPVETSSSHKIQTESPRPPTYSVCSLSLPSNRTSVSSFTSVTTDLGLGTFYAITSQEPGNLKFEDYKSRRSYFSGTTEFGEVSGNASNDIASLSSSCPELGERVDPKDFKSLWRELAEKVGYQEEAICTVSQTISRCRTGHGMLHGSRCKGDIWFSFLGHDKVGKRRTAAALAELCSGDRENLIYVDLSSEDGMSRSNSIFDNQDLNSYYTKLRRKTIVDYIAEELSRKRHSVVLLENVDKADLLAQSSLSRAIRTGKFPDSHGREISINNVIFVTTSNTTESSKEIISGKKHVQYSEERILGAKGWQMQVLVRCVSGHATRTNTMNTSVTPRKENLNPKSANKRKLIDMNDSMEQLETLETQKRSHKSSKSYLDLNLPVEEEEEGDPDYGNSDIDYNPENCEAWLVEFFRQVDGKVVFKPFDFDALAKEVLKEIDRIFRKTLGSKLLLEIDEEVMVQILAAAWLSERKRAVEDWIEQVLGKSFAEAQQRHELTTQFVVKLVACEGLLTEEQAPGICLPARINF